MAWRYVHASLVVLAYVMSNYDYRDPGMICPGILVLAHEHGRLNYGANSHPRRCDAFDCCPTPTPSMLNISYFYLTSNASEAAPDY